jgi:hypothetical protein
MDLENKKFRGSISNRICPACYEKEWEFLYNCGRVG